MKPREAMELKRLAQLSDRLLDEAQRARGAAFPEPPPPLTLAPAFETMVLLSSRAFARERELARRRAVR